MCIRDRLVGLQRLVGQVGGADVGRMGRVEAPAVYRYPHLRFAALGSSIFGSVSLRL